MWRSALVLVAAIGVASAQVPFAEPVAKLGDSELETAQKTLQAMVFSNSITITPNDSTDLTHATTAIYVGGAGDLKVNLAGGSGNPVTFKAVPVGTTLMINATRVFATGTAATNLVGLY